MMENEKQVKLGNLQDMNIDELDILLQKQTKILSNKSFVNRLPDKGEKIRKLVARIEHVMSEKSKVQHDIENATELFEKMAVDADAQRLLTCDEEDTDDSMLRELVNREHIGKIVTEEKPSQYINTYDRIIKKTPSKSQTKKFHPNRTLNHSSINSHMKKSLPSNIHLKTVCERNENSDSVDSNEISSDKLNNKAQASIDTELLTIAEPKIDSPSRLPKHGYDESLQYKTSTNRRAVSIPIEESIKLMQEQKNKHDMLQAVQAAHRLTGKLVIPGLQGKSTVTFNPDIVPPSAYRHQDVHSDLDSDDEEPDYPD